MFRLLTLGRLDLTDPDGREITSILTQPKRLALLSYLAVTNSARFRRRDAAGLAVPALRGLLPPVVEARVHPHRSQ